MTYSSFIDLDETTFNLKLSEIFKADLWVIEMIFLEKKLCQKSPISTKNIIGKVFWGGVCIIFAVTIATPSKAASIRPDTNVFVLLTGQNQGGSEDMGTGMFKLSNEIRDLFSTEYSDEVLNLEIFQGGDLPSKPDGEKNDAIEYINEFDENDFLTIIGYSLGGDTAVEIARSLNPNRRVDLLITVDPFVPAGSVDSVPKNVSYSYNYVQTCITRTPFNDRFCDSPGQIERGETLAGLGVNGATKVNVEDLFNDRSITHGGSKGIDKDSRVHDLILDNIREVQAKIPEPSSVFTFLGFVSLGVISRFRRGIQKT